MESTTTLAASADVDALSGRAVSDHSGSLTFKRCNTPFYTHVITRDFESSNAEDSQDDEKTKKAKIERAKK